MNEPQWTAEQNQILGKFWSENHENFDITAILPQLDGHTKRGAQFRLRDLTQKKNSKFLPLFSMDKDEW